MTFDQFGRRDFVRLLVGGAAALPFAARAQQPERTRRIGVLMAWPESDPEAQSEVASFVQELQKLGWTEGRNLQIDMRWWIPADPQPTHRFAKELVTLRPDVILSQGTSTTAALLQETRTIPTVFAVVADPIGSGSSRASPAQAVIPLR
jgi:putative ABC transport system substrate-binding protein